jgi:hypothetical protein
MRYAKPLVAVGLMVVVALPYVASFRAPIYAEEAAYAYVPWASQVTGQAFYNAAFENKTPGIFWLFQAVQGYDQPGVGRARLVQGALVWATALILLLWLSESVSLLAGAVAAFTYALTVPTLVWWRTTVMAQTEPPMVLFTTLGFFLLYRGLRTSRSFWFILAGMALAGGFIFKQIAVLELVASVVVVLLLTRDLPGMARWRRAGMVLGGSSWWPGRWQWGWRSLARERRSGTPPSCLYCGAPHTPWTFRPACGPLWGWYGSRRWRRCFCWPHCPGCLADAMLQAARPPLRRSADFS